MHKSRTEWKCFYAVHHTSSTYVHVQNSVFTDRKSQTTCLIQTLGICQISASKNYYWIQSYAAHVPFGPRNTHILHAADQRYFSPDHIFYKSLCRVRILLVLRVAVSGHVETSLNGHLDVAIETDGGVEDTVETHEGHWAMGLVIDVEAESVLVEI